MFMKFLFRLYLHVCVQQVQHGRTTGRLFGFVRFLTVSGIVRVFYGALSFAQDGAR